MTDMYAMVLDAPFMQRALAVAVICGLVCGAVGCFVVLRGLAFIGDAVAHAVFPGVAVAFALQVDLLLGGTAAGLAVAVGVALLTQDRRLKEDTIIGVFFATAFGIGIVVLSLTPSYSGSLESFLFGSILGISDAHVRLVAAVAAAVLLVLGALLKELICVALDRETARAAGLPVVALDVILYVLITLAVVISLQAVGNILVLALLVTPAASARLLTDRLETMLILAAGIGAAGGVTGLLLSYALDIAAGGAIVLVLTGAFVGCRLIASPGGAAQLGR